MKSTSTPIQPAQLSPHDLWARPGQALDAHSWSVHDRSTLFGGIWGGKLLAGASLWHDFGKARPAFQVHVRDESPHKRRGSVIHSTAGPIHLLERYRKAFSRPTDSLGRLPPVLVAGLMAMLAHHGNLTDRTRVEERLGLTTPGARFPGLLEYEEALGGGLPAKIVNFDPFEGVNFRAKPNGLLVRMMFSALVDADKSDAAGLPNRVLTSFVILKARFEEYMAGLSAKNADNVIGQLRDEVLVSCVAMASHAPGFFALDAPTGFAKTFSSLAFAIEHARLHGLTRIIYVAPFLTAIEQTANAFRVALGDTKDRIIVVEDHSMADRNNPAQTEVGDEFLTGVDEAEDKTLRATWEGVIIVTSNVQFFESLHSHSNRRCRKLHRIANAVVLIDEPQSLPIHLFSPTAETLRALVEEYRSTVVLITATQPAFDYDAERFPSGLRTITSMLSSTLLQRLRAVANARIRTKLPIWTNPDLSIGDVADRVMASNTATLCIVNTRKDAQYLFAAVVARSTVPGDIYHLSAAMCSDHRSLVLAEVCAKLDAGVPIKVISTQVLEAGIDVDFPHVMRALAPLDSLIQAAGRCNRHGLLSAPGLFEVFCLESGIPFMLRTAASKTQILLEGGMDMLDPKTSTSYYRQLRRVNDTGLHLVKEQKLWNFETVGKEYRLIEPTMTLVVPFGQRGRDAVARLLRFVNKEFDGHGKGSAFQGTSGLMVNIREKAAKDLVDRKLVVKCGDFGVLVALPGDGCVYDETGYGLSVGGAEPSLMAART